MKRRALILTAVLGLLAAVLCACRGQESGQVADPIALGESMMERAGGLPAMSVVTSAGERGEELFPYLSDLDYGKTDGYYFAYAEAGTAEEIAVIRLKDEADAAEAKASLERHVEKRLGIFRAYDPEQALLVEDAQVLTAGNLVALVICPDGDAVCEAFRQGSGG